MKTNFFVSVASPLTSATPHKDYVLHLATNAYALRDVDYVPKFHRINDPTVKTAEEAAIVALSAARIWGKEANVAMAVMIGDPTLTPGEVIQVIGSPLLGSDSGVGGGLHRLASDREKYIQFESNAKQMILDYSSFSANAGKNNRDPVRDGRNTTPRTTPTPNTTYIEKIENNSILGTLYDQSKVLFKIGTPSDVDGSTKTIANTQEMVTTASNLSTKSATSQQYGAGVDPANPPDNAPKGFEELPRTIYRIEAIQHRFSLGSLGFTSELALISAL